MNYKVIDLIAGVEYQTRSKQKAIDYAYDRLKTYKGGYVIRRNYIAPQNCEIVIENLTTYVIRKKGN